MPLISMKYHMTIWIAEFIIEYNLDTRKHSSRLFFLNSPKRSSLKVPVTLVKGKEYCEKRKIFLLVSGHGVLKTCSQIVWQGRIALQPNVSDKLTPLQINATHSLRRRADLESISLYPSVVDTRKNYDVIQIQRNCGKGPCTYDIRKIFEFLYPLPPLSAFGPDS